MRNRKDYWNGFTAGAGLGALATLGAMAGWRLFGVRAGSQRVLRMERSVQVGKPVQEVFSAWSDFDRLQALVPMIKVVQRVGDHTYWQVEVKGRLLHWDAQLFQDIPNQALGWKSVSGPKHSGRISFAPLGDDTQVHVVMNYAPPVWRFARALAPLQDAIGNHIEQALRDFKAGLEGKGQESVMPQRSTGTFGSASRPSPRNSMGIEPPAVGPAGSVSYTTERPGTVEYTRPPKDKS